MAGRRTLVGLEGVGHDRYPMTTDPFAQHLPDGTPAEVALWAEAIYWRHTIGLSAAAKRLGLSERTVQRRCRNYARWLKKPRPEVFLPGSETILSAGGHLSVSEVDKNEAIGQESE